MTATTTRTRQGALLPLLLAALLLSQLGPAMAAGVDSLTRATAALQTWVAGHPGQTVPVIVETTGDAAPVATAATAAGATNVQRLTDSAFSAMVPAAVVDQLSRSSRVARVNFNAPVRLLSSAVDPGGLLNRYERFSYIPRAWYAGLDGSGVQVAVLDSGVYPHDDLTLNSPRVPGNSGNRLLPLTTNANATDAIDHLGHGTHVAGIIGGNGYDSNGHYVGVAPNALLISVKVSDDAGNMNEGDVITGLEWVYQANKNGFHIRVVNLSLGSTQAQSYNQSALDAMVEKLWKSGVVVVVSASTADAGSVDTAPANDPFAITVGSVEDNFKLSVGQLTVPSWSPVGQTQDGFGKPEVVADGSHVVSLSAAGSIYEQQHPESIVAGHYMRMSGTSMAAPQVTGLVALLLQARPGLAPNDVKQRLVDGSRGFGSTALSRNLGNFTRGGLVTSRSIAISDSSSANGGVTFSASFDPNQMAIRAGQNVWLQDANWSGTSWQESSWMGTSWQGTSWQGTSWQGTSWQNTSWNGTSWQGAAWDGTSWQNTSWQGTSWNGTSWNNTSWQGTSWNGTSWNGTSWNNTSWNGTSWNNTSWNSNWSAGSSSTWEGSGDQGDGVDSSDSDGGYTQ